MRFREYIEEQGLSQTEAARRAKVSVAAVHRAYHGLPLGYENVRRLVLWCGGLVSYDDFAAAGRRRAGGGRDAKARARRTT